MIFLWRYTSTDLFFPGISHAEYFKKGVEAIGPNHFSNIMLTKDFSQKPASHMLEKEEEKKKHTQTYLRIYFLCLKSACFLVSIS